MNGLARRMGGALARYLNQPARGPYPHLPADLTELRKILRPADVVLVDGRARISTAIKYLTQSTWSHVALYVGDYAGNAFAGRPHLLVEADTEQGVHLLDLQDFGGYHLRICRPMGLSDDDAHRVVNYAMARLGQCYDLKNVFDLARYLLPTPPVPGPWRRRMLALGSGDPTRAICSTLVAEAFQSIPFPILPVVRTESAATPECHDCIREIFHIRDHSLYTPRDFDVSPYFDVIKPSLTQGFNYKRLTWDADPEQRTAA
ncbi:MAG: YiiX/YebB-like N1pC/P60 family cysteine hydrolase [Rhodanobacter sp.]